MTGKSIWAVVAGVLFIVIASILVDIVLHLVGVYPKMGEPIGDGLALLATSYRFVIGIGGGVGVVLGLIGVALTWNQNVGPRWYAIALAVLAIPQCWLGGRIFEARSGKR